MLTSKLEGNFTLSRKQTSTTSQQRDCQSFATGLSPGFPRVQEALASSLISHQPDELVAPHFVP